MAAIQDSDVAIERHLLARFTNLFSRGLTKYDLLLSVVSRRRARWEITEAFRAACCSRGPGLA